MNNKWNNPVFNEVENRLYNLPEVQQWGTMHIKPCIMRKYRRKVVNQMITEQVYFSGIDFYKSVRMLRTGRTPIGFFKAICIVFGWCKS